MVETSPSNPNRIVPPTLPSQPPTPTPTPTPPPASRFRLPARPPLRVTSEFDSDSLVFCHRVSCKLFDNLAKLKLFFNNNADREISQPQLALTSKYLSIHYDIEDNNALLKSSVDVGPRLQLKATHDVKGRQGDVAVVATLPEPGYALELSSLVPVVGYPRATFKFPLGVVSVEEKQVEDEKERQLSINGIVKSHVLNGLCTAQYNDEELKLRYSYKDEALSFIPSISLPSNALSFAFKRRFGPSNKLSYSYKFDSEDWNAVYKHTYGEDLKLKAGYDSEVRLGWASLWVGNESGKSKTAPMKMKVQFMLQVPQDDIKKSALMFRVKKRWDI